MADIESRLGRLERTLARLTGGAIVAGIMLLAFLGATSFYQIPKKIAEVVPRAIDNYVESKLPGFGEKLQGFLTEAQESADRLKKHADELEALADALRGGVTLVQTGRVEIHKNKIPNLWEVKVEHCPEKDANRGELNGRVNFPESFLSPPKVLMAFSSLDFSHGRNLRIVADAWNVDEKGFDYALLTWCNTKVWRVIASWIAVGERLVSK